MARYVRFDEGPPMDVVSISGPSTFTVTFVGAVPVAIR
jgi:hypothetical protein